MTDAVRLRHESSAAVVTIDNPMVNAVSIVVHVDLIAAFAPMVDSNLRLGERECHRNDCST